MTTKIISNSQVKAVRTLPELCREIRKDWGSKMYFGAVPYFKAMETLNNVGENYGMDSGKSIVLYFLANAQTWKGPIAKQVKIELKKLAGVK